MLRMPDITLVWSILAGKSLWSRGLRARLAGAIMQAVRQAFGIAIGGNLPEGWIDRALNLKGRLGCQ